MLYTFDNIHGVIDGVNRYAGLIQGQDGAFYGTTQFGGSSSSGTVFRFSGGKTAVLHSFIEQNGQIFPDGAYPYAALVQASDGNFYGTTSFGGALTIYYQPAPSSELPSQEPSRNFGTSTRMALA